MFNRGRFFPALILLLAGSCLLAQPDAPRPKPGPFRIAAAADLQPALPPLLREFETQTGIRADASFQSSATLANQIINGAPFDLFLAADISFPQRVIDAGRAEETRPLPYAEGTLVLWTRNDSGVSSLAPGSLTSDQTRASG